MPHRARLALALLVALLAASRAAAGQAPASEPPTTAAVPASGRHTVAIRGDGKPYATFFFRFDPKDPDALCLIQNDMYQWWQLFWTKRSFERCRCQGIEPSVWRASGP